MTVTFVVDSSIVPKWFVAENHTIEASRLRSGYELVAPNFLTIELTSILTEKVRRGSLSEFEATQILRAMRQAPIRLLDDQLYLEHTLQLAVQYHPSAYDCLYAAVGLALGVQVVTADREFYDNLRKPYPETMLWVADIPA